MKTIMVIALLGLISGAVYAKGGFTDLKGKLKPVNVKSENKTEAEHAKSSISQSYDYVNLDREY